MEYAREKEDKFRAVGDLVGIHLKYTVTTPMINPIIEIDKNIRDEAGNKVGFKLVETYRQGIENGIKYPEGALKIIELNKPTATPDSIYRMVKDKTTGIDTIYVGKSILGDYTYELDSINKTASIISYKLGAPSEVKIPARTVNDVVTKIKSGAFIGRTITKLFIPETITVIEAGASGSLTGATVYLQEGSYAATTAVAAGRFNGATIVLIKTDNISETSTDLSSVDIKLVKGEVYKEKMWVPLRGNRAANQAFEFAVFLKIVPDEDVLKALGKSSNARALELRKDWLYINTQLLAWGENNKLYMSRDLSLEEKDKFKNVIGVRDEMPFMVGSNFMMKYPVKIFPKIKF
jgi:hypothetical protein